MSDPLNIDPSQLGKAGRESEEVARQQATQRMGAGFVVAHEKPVRAMTMVDGKPVALPWSVGKPIGHQMDAFGGVRRVVIPGDEMPRAELTFDLDSKESQRLERGAMEAETFDAVNRGVGRPETDAYNESDHLAMNDGVTNRCSRRVGCIWLEGHDGECHIDPAWED